LFEKLINNKKNKDNNSDSDSVLLHVMAHIWMQGISQLCSLHESLFILTDPLQNRM